MAGGWEIRRGDRGDLPGLESAWRSLHAHHSDVGTAPVPTIPADLRWPERLREFQQAFDQERALLLVAERAGETAGFAFSTLHGPDPIFEGGPVGELDVLVVMPGLRDEGIGEALVRRSVAELRAMGADTLRVVVMAGNEDALRFYERLGIRPALIDLLAPLDAVSGESS